MLSEGFTVASYGLLSDELPAVVRQELNADRDRDVIERMKHLAMKKRMRQPDITDEQLADYLALAENCDNLTHWLRVRREADAPVRSGALWAALTVAAVAALSAMLIVAIALAV